MDPTIGVAVVAFCCAAGAGGIFILGLLAWCSWQDHKERIALGKRDE
jgi:hypothetical protein